MYLGSYLCINQIQMELDLNSETATLYDIWLIITYLFSTEW